MTLPQVAVVVESLKEWATEKGMKPAGVVRSGTHTLRLFLDQPASVDYLLWTSSKPCAVSGFSIEPESAPHLLSSWSDFPCPFNL